VPLTSMAEQVLDDLDLAGCQVPWPDVEHP
jgi:hypothetical protein